MKNLKIKLLLAVSLVFMICSISAGKTRQGAGDYDASQQPYSYADEELHGGVRSGSDGCE